MYKNHYFITLISIFLISLLFAGCSENKENLKKKYTLSKETYIKLREAKGLSNVENVIREKAETDSEESEYGSTSTEVEDNTDNTTVYTEVEDNTDNTTVYTEVEDNTDNTTVYTEVEDNRILTITEVNFSLDEKEKIYFIYSIFKFIKNKYHDDDEFNNMTRFLSVIDFDLNVFRNNKRTEISNFINKLETLSLSGVDVTKFINQKLILLKNELLEFNNQKKDYNNLLSFI